MQRHGFRAGKEYNMRARDPFSELHPVTALVFFVFVIIFSMIFMHPVPLMISFAGSIAYAAALKGKRILGMFFGIMLPVMLFAAAVNAAFNHRGVTILAYFPTGNALTLESLLYGAGASVMLAAVMGWFICWSEVMSPDKIMYLTGRTIPSLSLVISMTLRYVPLFIRRYREVRETQQCIGRIRSGGGFTGKIRNGVDVFSVMLTWSLENAVVTSESMRSRGYGLPGRTSYTIYRFSGRDKAVLLWTAICGIIIITGWKAGSFKCQYYPEPVYAGISPFACLVWSVYFVLCITPVLLKIAEDVRWKR